MINDPKVVLKIFNTAAYFNLIPLLKILINFKVGPNYFLVSISYANTRRAFMMYLRSSNTITIEMFNSFLVELEE